LILLILNIRKHRETFPHSTFFTRDDGGHLSVHGAYTTAHSSRVWPVRIAGLLGLGCCRAKPIIAYKGEENRLPGSTGRAEVTVLLWKSEQ
jgi:hypothetical protein